MTEDLHGLIRIGEQIRYLESKSEKPAKRLFECECAECDAKFVSHDPRLCPCCGLPAVITLSERRP